MDIRGFDDCERVGVFCGVSHLSRACLAPVSRLSRGYRTGCFACFAAVSQVFRAVSRLIHIVNLCNGLVAYRSVSKIGIRIGR